MAHQDNLNKIAQEFVMIDDYYRRTRRSYGPPKTIDSKQAAKIYGGVLEITGRRPPIQQGCLYQQQPSKSVVHQVKPGEEKVISFYEGGVSVMDYSKNKSRAMAY